MAHLTGTDIKLLYDNLKDDIIKAHDLTPNEKRYILGYIRLQVKRLTELRDYVRENKGNENYQLEQMPEYNNLIRFKNEIEESKRYKKQPYNPEKKLSDVLLKGISVEKILSIYNQNKHSNKYLGTFLRYLNELGYFDPAIKGEDIQIIGRNSFNKPRFNDRKEYNVNQMPVNKDGDKIGYEHIPIDPKSLIK